MESTTLLAGDPIEARCTKCRKNTDHIIITMGEEGPVKVQCGSCSRQHKYRPPTVPKKPAVRRAVDPKIAERKEWEQLKPTMEDMKGQDYSMTASYKLNSLINHPVFGLGMVQRVVGAQKIEVLFEDGKKTMRCK
ncbi:MAG: hypothetical protein J7K75_08845 [Desulfuromonas sp.]|nr:hypothetical protein [Desulfuromonas sp.]